MTDSRAPLQRVKALYFDVFGTTVDWRSTVTNALYTQAQKALGLSDSPTPTNAHQKASQMDLNDWGAFAQKWRESYYAFTQKLAQDALVPYKTIDEHHLDSLKHLLGEWQLVGLWEPDTVKELSLVWHKLDPWPDAVEGIKALNKKFQTCTLSNGNLSLLTDMAEYAGLMWTHILSAEMFKTYKPNPEVYLGGAGKLGLQPEECAMVACHLNDLHAAHSQGFRTIYVERPLEEQWHEEMVAEAKQKGWVDMWIVEGSGGFLTVATEFGTC